LQRLRLDLAITAIEFLPRNARALAAIVPVIEGDFLTMPFEEKFDHVAMNPPFARGADIRHVSKALDLVRPGGSLAAIMSAGVCFREDKRTKAFRARVHHIGTFEPLPPSSFAESGTHVNTCLLWIPEIP
jgi:16S rRNA G1207 methylase RsmC